MPVSNQKLADSIVGAAILFRHKLTQAHRAILFQQVDAYEVALKQAEEERHPAECECAPCWQAGNLSWGPP